jgi:hypothetical protein
MALVPWARWSLTELPQIIFCPLWDDLRWLFSFLHHALCHKRKGPLHSQWPLHCQWPLGLDVAIHVFARSGPQSCSWPVSPDSVSLDIERTNSHRNETNLCGLAFVVTGDQRSMRF